jgi:hypothetical protein
MVGCGRWKSLPKKAGAYPFPYRDHQIVGCKAEAAVLYSAEAVDAKMAALTAKLAQTQQAMAQLLADKEQSSVARHAEQMVRIDRTQDAVLQAVRELDQRILNHKALADLKAELRAELSAELSR